MTIQQDWEESDEYQDQEASSYRENVNVRPVKVEFEQTQNVAPESTAWMAWAIAVIGVGLQPTQICSHKYHRYKAKFLWTIPANTIVYLDRVADRLMSGALGTTFNIATGAAAIQSSVILPDYDGQQPLYAIANGPGVFVSVMDESFKAVQ